MQSRSSGQRGRCFCHTDGGTKEPSSVRECVQVEDGSLVPASCDKGTVPNRNFQIHANLPVSVPAPTSDRVCPPLARSALRVVAYFPGKDRYSFPLWLFSCRCDSPYEAGRRPGVSVFLAVARSAVPICRPGHQYRGQNKSRFRLEAAHFVQKTKCADFSMKSAAVGRFFARCNRKSLAAANTQSRFFRE